MRHATSRATGSRLPRLATLVLVVLAAACSGGDDGATEGGERDDAAGLERAAIDYASALLRGDADTVYDTLTADCRGEVDREELTVTLGFAQAFTSGVDVDDMLEGLSAETRDVADGRGEVRLELAEPPATDDPSVSISLDAEWRPMVWEDGAWRDPSCADLGGAVDDADASIPGRESDVDELDVGFPDVGDLDFATAGSTLVVDGERLGGSWNDLTSGGYTISLEATEDLGRALSRPDTDAEVAADGRFVGVTTSIVNEADGRVDLFFDVTTELEATDGTDRWVHDGDATRAATAARADVDPSGELDAGESATIVLVYDVPADAEVVGLAWGLDRFGSDGEPAALALP